jgi:hypothetical protein
VTNTVHKIAIGNPKRTRSRCRRLDNIENIHKETVCENLGWMDITASLKGIWRQNVDWIYLAGIRAIGGSGEHDNEPQVFHKSGTFLD